MKNKLTQILTAIVASLAPAICVPSVVFAADGGAGADAGMIAIGAGLAIGLVGLGGTLGQSKAISSGLDSIGRNPSAYGKIFLPMLLGLALIESLVIISFVIANSLAGQL